MSFKQFYSWQYFLVSSPYPPFYKLFSLKKLKNGGYGEVRWGTVGNGTATVRVRFGDANDLNSLEILYI